MATVPNFLSCLRLLLIPILLVLAWGESPRLFLSCLLVSIVTDALDGFIARRFKATSELGARLDSWADLGTYLALPFCLWWLRPEVIRAEAAFLMAAILSYLAAVLVGFAKYRRLTSYHTWLSKGLAILTGGVVLVLFAGGPGWPLRLLAPLIVLSCAEEIAITALLKEWRANVPSLGHALRIKRYPARVRPASDGR